MKNILPLLFLAIALNHSNALSAENTETKVALDAYVEEFQHSQFVIKTLLKERAALFAECDESSG